MFLPNAKLDPPNGRSYAAANGGAIKNKGQITTHTKTVEGHIRDITWQNVDVDFPIQSTHQMTNGGKWLLQGEDGGMLVDPNQKTIERHFRHGEVYFQKLFLPRRLMGNAADFVRQGVAP